MEDLKGMKIAGSAPEVPLMKALGAVPVVMPLPAFYESMDKGVADGVSIPYGALGGWKLYEVTKYHTNVHFGTGPSWTAMNIDTWNSLPPDIQQIVTEVSNKIPVMFTAAVTGEANRTINKIKELGQEIIELSPQERARWVATAEPIWNKWAADMEAKGLPGRAVLAEAIRIAEEYK